jgi:hypothetical protein
MGGVSTSQGGGAVCISLPDAASGGPLPSTAVGAGPIFLPNAAVGDTPTPSPTHLWAMSPPPPRCSSGRRPYRPPQRSRGWCPHPDPLLPWSIATGLEVWCMCSRSYSFAVEVWFIAI